MFNLILSICLLVCVHCASVQIVSNDWLYIYIFTYHLYKHSWVLVTFTASHIQTDFKWIERRRKNAMNYFRKLNCMMWLRNRSHVDQFLAQREHFGKSRIHTHTHTHSIWFNIRGCWIIKLHIRVMCIHTLYPLNISEQSSNCTT